MKQALLGAFVVSKEPLIRKLAHKAAAAEKTTADREDIYQAGRMGLLRALEDWDPDKGALSTHAGWWIKNHVQRVARDEQAIALPRIRLTTAERDTIIKALRKDPEITAEALGLNPSAFEQVKRSFGLRFVSVDMFGERDDAPVRVRRIERAISDAGEEPEHEEQMDARSLVRRAIGAVQELARGARIDLEDALAGLASALGCSPDLVKPRAQKDPPECPQTRKTPAPPQARHRLSPKPLPRMRLAVGAAVVRARRLLVERSLPSRSVRASPLPRRTMKPASPSSQPSNVSRLTDRPTSSDDSVRLPRKAA